MKLNTLLNLIKEKFKPIKFNKDIINYYSINSFDISKKKDNDKNNKIRENLISAIINKKIPEDYYKNSKKWKNLKLNIDNYLQELHGKKYNKINCIIKAGRKYNYDFIFKIDEKEYKIELKFNSSPQFVSPMKPSQYLTNNYEEYFYDNYLIKILEEFKLKIPNKKRYLEEIHSNQPKCLKEIQVKYYNGCFNSSKYSGKKEDIEFYNKMKEISNTSIKNFIKNNNLDIEKLSKYLIESQKDKHYMFYKDNHFQFIKTDENNYKIKSYIKDIDKFSYIATNEKGNKIKILLRWKNGNGIAYPAFQIS